MTNMNDIVCQRELEEMIRQGTCISNREALKDKIHDIHNFLRNNGAGYGMNALKVFNVIYGLKKIHDYGLIDKVNLERPYCDFSHLIALAKKEDGGGVASAIFKALDSIYDNKQIRHIRNNKLTDFFTIKLCTSALRIPIICLEIIFYFFINCMQIFQCNLYY